MFIIDPKRIDVYQRAKRTVNDVRTADKTNVIKLIKQYHKRMKKRQDELHDYFISNHNNEQTYRTLLSSGVDIPQVQFTNLLLVKGFTII